MSKLIILIITLCVSLILISGCASSGEQKIPSTTTISPTTISTMITSTVTSTIPEQKNQESVYKGVEQSTSNIQMIGNVYGIATNPATGIDEITFTITLAPGAPTLDLSKMVIIFSTENTKPVTYTQNTVATPTTSKFVTENVNNKGTVVTSMNPQDQVFVSFKTRDIGPNTKITIEIRPPTGAPLPFTKTAPPTIQKFNVLY